MNKSGIEWLENPDGSKGLTCNPVVGCDEHSPGCKNCWAKELVATRMIRNPSLPMYHDLARVTDKGTSQWTGIVKLVPERLQEIVALGRARKRNAEKKLEPYGSRVFVCDMSDLFHEKVPFEYIAAVFGAMACAPRSLFYVLTKRADRAVEFSRWLAINGGPTYRIARDTIEYGLSPEVADQAADAANTWPLPNVAFGVTCEDRRYGVPRLDLLRKFPARYRWASIEPQLESLAGVDFSGLDWIANGGEAHREGARPFDLQWAREVRDAARKAGALYFCKQLGDNVMENGVPLEFGKKGNVFERFPPDLQIRENLPMPRIP